MTHITTQIRSAAKALLADMDGISAASSSRLRTWGDSDLPCVSVWTPNETLTLHDKGSFGEAPTIKRNIQMFIEVIFEVSDEDSADVEADAWKVKIEQQMATTFSNLVQYLIPVTASEDFAVDDDDGSEWFGRVTYEFEAHTYTEEGLPEETA